MKRLHGGPGAPSWATQVPPSSGLIRFPFLAALTFSCYRAWGRPTPTTPTGPSSPRPHLEPKRQGSGEDSKGEAPGANSDHLANGSLSHT